MIKKTVLTSRANGITLHRIRNRSCVWMRDGKPNWAVATARYYRGSLHPHPVWLLRIPGHLWPVTPDMPTARNMPNVRETPVKGFRTWQECDRQVLLILE